MGNAGFSIFSTAYLSGYRVSEDEATKKNLLIGKEAERIVDYDRRHDREFSFYQSFSVLDQIEVHEIDYEV